MLKKNTAMITIGGLSYQITPERITATSKRNVMKSVPQVNLFLDPALLKNGLEIETLLAELKIGMETLATSAGTLMLMKLIEAEVQQMTGGRYDRNGALYSWGKQQGYICAGGRKVQIERTRVRRGRGKGEEVVPKSYRKFQEKSERANSVFSKALASVSCRKYPEAIEHLRSGYGISKSMISRELVAATSAELDRLCGRSLSDFDLSVLLIDGITLAGSVFICQPLHRQPLHRQRISTMFGTTPIGR